MNMSLWVYTFVVLICYAVAIESVFFFFRDAAHWASDELAWDTVDDAQDLPPR